MPEEDVLTNQTPVQEEEELQEDLVQDQEQDQDQDQDEEFIDEELDQIADTAIDVLKELLGFYDMHGVEINEYEGDEGEIILDVVGSDDLAILIGRRGHTLDALQLALSTITFHKLGFRYPVTVDIESYKHRQRQKLEAMAASAASRAYRQDKDVKLRPMNPYERRLIHIYLRDDDRVETFSEGVDPNRCVVIRPL